MDDKDAECWFFSFTKYFLLEDFYEEYILRYVKICVEKKRFM